MYNNKINTGFQPLQQLAQGIKLAPVLALTLLLGACGGGDDTDTGAANPVSIDTELKQIAISQSLPFNPLAGRTLPSINDPLPGLGRALFFSKTLSGDLDVACASCHHPLLAGADNLSMSVGVNPNRPELLGLGRVLVPSLTEDPVPGVGPNVPRNAPTTFNIAFYDKVMFHDGRLFSLGSTVTPNGEGQPFRSPDSFELLPDPTAGKDLTVTQAKFPITSLFEMRGFGPFSTLSNEDLRKAIATRLQASPEWVAKFRSAFGEPALAPDKLITFDRVAAALSEYQRSQVFMDLPWFRYLSGKNDAIPEDAKKGAKLFFTAIEKGGAGCVSCHSGRHFTNEEFHVAGFPQIGRGKNTFNEDAGRREVTQQEEDRFAFRVPSLVNVGKTSPYGHAGSFSSLYEVVAYHVNPEKGAAAFDYSLKNLAQFAGSGVVYPRAQANTKAAVDKFKTSSSFGKLFNPDLKDAQLQQLVAFLFTLTDPRVSVQSEMAPWIATSAKGDDPDGKMLKACFSSAALGFPCPPVDGGGDPGGGDPGGGSGGGDPVAAPDLIELPIDLALADSVVSAADARIALKAMEACSLQMGHQSLPSQSKFIPASGGLVLSHRQSNTLNLWFEDNRLDANVINTGSVATGDLNGDCWPDLLFAGGEGAGVLTYLNNAGKSVTNSDRIPSFTAGNIVNSIAVADIDGDYRPDVLLGNYVGRDFQLLENRWPNFTVHGKETTRIKTPHNTYGMAFADIDLDGDLDMATGHWTARFNIGRSAHMRENMGNWVFSARDVSQNLSNIVNSNDFSFSPNFADMNGDFKPDLLMAGDFENSQVYMNTGTGFQRTTDTAVVTDENGMGAAAADFDNDGDLDWFVGAIHATKPSATGSYGISGNRLYRNDGTGVLTDVTETAGVRNGGWSWGTCAADFDNDGDLDIYQANGYGMPGNVIDRMIAMYGDKLSDDERQQTDFLSFLVDTSRLFINDGNGRFTEQATAWGLAEARQGRGVSCLDFDRDGDMDVVVGNNEDTPSFFLNQVAGSPAAHFINIRLAGVSPNTAAVGARVYVRTGAKTQMREIAIGSNYLGHNLPEAHVGLGAATVIDEIRVVWPGGKQTTLRNNVAADQFLVLAHPDLL